MLTWLHVVNPEPSCARARAAQHFQNQHPRNSKVFLLYNLNYFYSISRVDFFKSLWKNIHFGRVVVWRGVNRIGHHQFFRSIHSAKCPFSYSTNPSNHPGANVPQLTATTFAFSSVRFFLHAVKHTKPLHWKKQTFVQVVDWQVAKNQKCFMILKCQRHVFSVPYCVHCLFKKCSQNLQVLQVFCLVKLL